MKKTSLFTLSLLSLFVTQACWATSDIVISDKSPDAMYDNITTITIPSANNQDISHIYYDEFNISSAGLELDNEQAQAQLIINEVISEKRTTLDGKLAVTGKMADVIIANPNGLDCFDCSFSGVNDVKLISGSSIEKFDKTFKLSNQTISFNFEQEIAKVNQFTDLERYNDDITTGHSINIISNNIDIEKGDLNAKYIRFDMGLNYFKIGSKNNNYMDFKEPSTLSISKEAGINSYKLIIKADGATIDNRGDINTRILTTKARTLNNDGILDINLATNIYRANDKAKYAYFDVKNYFGDNNSSLFANDATVYINTQDDLYLNGKTYLTNAKLYADSKNVTIENVNLINSNIDVKSGYILIEKEIKGTGKIILDGETELDKNAKVLLNKMDIKKNIKDSKRYFNSADVKIIKDIK